MEPTFREFENARRVDAARNDGAAHAFLERLNDLLQGDPLALAHGDATGVPEHPTIFVMGLPRAGTTLLMQVIAAGLDVGFVDCIAARFWRAPVYGLRLSRQLAGDERRFTFESRFGTPASPFEPHEFSYFWHRWMPPDDAGHTVDWAELTGALAAMQRETGGVMVFKGLAALGRIEELALHLPRAVFVEIDRDPIDTTASLLAARRRYYGAEDQWWSLVPQRHAELEGLEPVEQVAGQVALLRDEFRAALSTVPDGRVLSISYADLCVDADGVVERIRTLCRDAGGVDLARRDPALPTFEVRRPGDAEPRRPAIRAALSRFGVETRNDDVSTVPHTRVRIDPAAARSVEVLVRAGRLATGERVAALEEALAARLDGRSVACVSSGMAALQMILHALGGAGRRLAMPSFVCEALALAAVHAGTPVRYLDVDARTMNLPANTESDDVLVVPHLWGVPAPVHTMRAPMVVEDVAHAIGGRCDGRPCGAIAPIAFTSFYATKLIAGGYGGAVIADDPALIAEVRDRRQYNHRPQFRHREQYPMSDLCAEIALHELDRLDEQLARRTAIAARYDEAFRDGAIERQHVPAGVEPVWYRYVATVGNPDGVIAAARAANVQVLRAMPRGQHDLTGTEVASLPATDHLCAHTISLPMYADLQTAEQKRVVDAVKRFNEEPFPPRRIASKPRPSGKHGS